MVKSQCVRLPEFYFADAGLPCSAEGACGAWRLFISRPLGSGTKLELTYAVVGYLPAGMNTWAAQVDSVQIPPVADIADQFAINVVRECLDIEDRLEGESVGGRIGNLSRRSVLDEQQNHRSRDRDEFHLYIVLKPAGSTTAAALTRASAIM
jgi:hypothetical protein